jgi:hypothetical protein
LELRDLIVTPLLLIVIYLVAYRIRPFFTDSITRRYFIPALTVRIIGALAVGFVYQFYYDGGDTFNYHTHGSRHLWEAFWDSPEKAWKLFFFDGDFSGGIYEYYSKIIFIRDPASYTVVRTAFIFDIITFSSYSATAVCFSLISFAGMWMFFITFYRYYPHLHMPLALVSFFIPSVFFWGSGILKDTLTLAAVGFILYTTNELFIQLRFSVWKVTLLVLASTLLYTVKIYILMVLLPALIIWIMLFHLEKVKTAMVKVLILPFVAILALFGGYYAIVIAGADNPKYSMDMIGKTAQITAYDILYYTGKDAGSGYSLGELDGSFQSLVKLAPQAVIVSIFRPFLWEVRNPLMMLSALESLCFLMAVCYLIFFRRLSMLYRALTQRNVVFLLVFAVVFAFAVGVSTFNFGTLVRYKIPMMPALGAALSLMLYYSKSPRKLDVLEVTE